MVEFKLDKFDQIGIVVRNILETKTFLETVFKFNSPLNIVEQWSDVEYKGENVRFKMKKIMQTFNNIQFEIVELLESTGDHLYLEFLKEGKEGLHHLGIYEKNAEKLIENYKNEFGIEVIQTGKAGKVKFDYLDTKDVLGFYLELISF
jgi:hypothetical protein